MPASAFTWDLAIRHCPAASATPTPVGATRARVGRFKAPPHEYPSHLLLTRHRHRQRRPDDIRTIQLGPEDGRRSTFASAPSGATVTVGADHTAPYSETFLQGSPVTVTAAPTTGSGATVAAFGSWSDGGARSHAVAPPPATTTYTATYTRPTRP